jgi:hypothetical protein
MCESFWHSSEILFEILLCINKLYMCINTFVCEMLLWFNLGILIEIISIHLISFRVQIICVVLGNYLMICKLFVLYSWSRRYLLSVLATLVFFLNMFLRTLLHVNLYYLMAWKLSRTIPRSLLKFLKYFLWHLEVILISFRRNIYWSMDKVCFMSHLLI